MRIGIAFDLAPASRPADEPDDLFEEFDKPETVEAIARVLRGAGHEVVLLGDGRELLMKLLEDPPDLVWNLAEGEGVGRCRESRVPAVLEMLDIPCTGSDPFTLAAALDKPVAKALVSGVVAVPLGWILGPRATGQDLQRLASGLSEGRGPWIVKPAFEGSSKGIRARSLVDTPEQALELAGSLARDYRQPILVEEYILGDEVTVGIVGNGPTAEVVGAMKVRPKVRDDRFVYSLEYKRDWDDRIDYETPARLPADATLALHTAALGAFAALGCRDVARIDFRVREGVPYFLEANPLPGLAPDWSDLVILANGMGLGHPALILKILDATLTRIGRLVPRRVGPPG